MKHTSASGRFMQENLTKGRLLGKALTRAISTLGLVGSLALFKEIEQAIDPSDSDGQSALAELIKKVEEKIKQKSSENDDQDTGETDTY